VPLLADTTIGAPVASDVLVPEVLAFIGRLEPFVAAPAEPARATTKITANNNGIFLRIEAS
jgi:hypothetical protein